MVLALPFRCLPKPVLPMDGHSAGTRVLCSLSKRCREHVPLQGPFALGGSAQGGCFLKPQDIVGCVVRAEPQAGTGCAALLLSQHHQRAGDQWVGLGQEVPLPGADMVSVPRSTSSTFFVPTPHIKPLLCAPETSPAETPRRFHVFCWLSQAVHRLHPRWLSRGCISLSFARQCKISSSYLQTRFCC